MLTRASLKSVRFENNAPVVHVIAPGMSLWTEDEWSPELSLYAQANARALAEQAVTTWLYHMTLYCSRRCLVGKCTYLGAESSCTEQRTQIAIQALIRSTQLTLLTY
jgi:hypothetical protein